MASEGMAFERVVSGNRCHLSMYGVGSGKRRQGANEEGARREVGRLSLSLSGSGSDEWSSSTFEGIPGNNS